MDYKQILAFTAHNEPLEKEQAPGVASVLGFRGSGFRALWALGLYGLRLLRFWDLGFRGSFKGNHKGSFKGS